MIMFFKNLGRIAKAECEAGNFKNLRYALTIANMITKIPLHPVDEKLEIKFTPEKGKLKVLTVEECNAAPEKGVYTYKGWKVDLAMLQRVMKKESIRIHEWESNSGFVTMSHFGYGR